MATNLKKRIFDIIQIGHREDFPSRAFDIILVIAIILNIAVLFIETFSFAEPYYDFLKALEFITVLFFAVEYLLRIWTSEYLYPDKKRGIAALRFMVSFGGIVDLFTILPFFYLSGFVALRMLRVVRIFHLFRINAYYDSFNVITSVLYEKRNQIISSVFIIFVLMMASSLCMYSVEHDAQPEVFDNAFSGLWWSISTILTVGYGDLYPVTTLGRLLAILISLLGVGVVAIPTGIISAGFVEQYTSMQKATGEEPLTHSISTLLIDGSHSMKNLDLKRAEQQFHIRIILIIRNGEVLLPPSNLKIKPGDTIVYQSL